MYSLQNRIGNIGDRKVVSLFSALNGFITRMKMNFFWKNNKLLKYTEWGKCQEVEKIIGRNPGAIEVRNKDGNTPLLIASLYGNVEMVKLLTSYGADLNARTSLLMNDDADYLYMVEDEYESRDGLVLFGIGLDTKTPLMLASIYGYPEVVRELTVQGASVDATDKNGVTALMMAATFCRVECVKILLETGADLEAKNSDGETVVDYADDIEVEKVLEEYSGDTEEDKQKSVKEHLENLKIMFITLSEELIGVVYEACTKEQIQIQICGNCKNAIERLKKEQYDVIFLDIPGEISSLDNEIETIIPVDLPENSHSKDESGLSDLRNLRSSAKEAFIIRCYDSDPFTMELRDLLIDNGANDCITRHFSIEQLISCLVRASEVIINRKKQREIEDFRKWVEENYPDEEDEEDDEDEDEDDEDEDEDDEDEEKPLDKFEELKFRFSFFGMLAIVIAYIILMYLGKI